MFQFAQARGNVVAFHAPDHLILGTERERERERERFIRITWREECAGKDRCRREGGGKTGGTGHGGRIFMNLTNLIYTCDGVSKRS